MNSLARPKAWFMIFRIQAVFVWAVLTVVVGTAVAARTTGEVNWIHFFLCILIASAVQGFPAHIVNEIVDWRSGADRPREQKSGGSKVLASGLATIPQLWVMFWITTTVALGLVIVLCLRTNWNLGVLFLVGYFICLAYSIPPFRLAYRPFLGEWLGGFPGIVLNIVGSAYAQGHIVTWETIGLAASIGMMYIGIMLLFHYVDYEGDQQARPIKRTSIVFFGLRRSRHYVLAILIVASALSAALAAQGAPWMWVISVLAFLHAIVHFLCDPASVDSIIRSGKWLMVCTVLGVTVGAALVSWHFWLLLPAAAWVRMLHHRFGRRPVVSR